MYVCLYIFFLFLQFISVYFLGKYQGSTDEEEYLVDMIADFCIDWRGDISRATFIKVCSKLL